jgi:energy-coupling factor transport system substrate-specific component
MSHRLPQLLSFTIYGLCTVIGVVAFLYPFWLPVVQQTANTSQARADDSPLLLTVLVGLCFMVMLLQVQTEVVSTKFIALLGILVAINSVLRFAEVAVPGPGGFSPIFFLIILTGYVYGGRLGFLMGALTLLVSSLITGGVGPWLPYQMFTTGWVGLSAPLCRPTVWLLRGENKGTEIIVLAVFAAWWGLVYGLIMNIWFWPFATGPTTQYWQPGISLSDTLTRYAAFYLTTSLIWDLFRAAGNVVLMLTMGQPVLRVLRRFQQRFEFRYIA